MGFWWLLDISSDGLIYVKFHTSKVGFVIINAVDDFFVIVINNIVTVDKRRLQSRNVYHVFVLVYNVESMWISSVYIRYPPIALTAIHYPQDGKI